MGIGLAVAAVLALLGADGELQRWMVRLLSVSVTCFVSAWLAQRGWLGPVGRLLPPSDLLAPAAVGVVVAAAIGVAGFLARARVVAFGWRHLATPVIAASLMVAIVPSVWSARSGRWHAPQSDWIERLGWLDRPTVWIGDPGVLMLPNRPFRHSIAVGMSNGVPDIRSMWPPVRSQRARAVSEAVQSAVEHGTSHLGAELAGLGVGYIVVLERAWPGAPIRYPVGASVRAGLDRQLDLQQIELGGGAAVYRTPAAVGSLAAASESPVRSSARTRAVLSILALVWLWAISAWRRLSRVHRVHRDATAAPAELAPVVDPYLWLPDDSADERGATPAAGTLANELFENFRRRRSDRSRVRERE